MHLDNAQFCQRFCRLWTRAAAEPDAARAEALFTELAAYYAEPHRHYHTGLHIRDCLARMDLAAATLGRSDSVELAIWFHDVIYTPGAPDNESRSAEWFAEQSAGWLAEDTIAQVTDYIMSTTHRELPDDPGAQYVVDVDISGMGMSAENFDRDSASIRKEFAHLNDADFNRGQAVFLQKLLDRPRIYATDFFYDLCEATARRNIAGLLERCPG